MYAISTIFLTATAFTKNLKEIRKPKKDRPVLPIFRDHPDFVTALDNTLHQYQVGSIEADIHI